VVKDKTSPAIFFRNSCGFRNNKSTGFSRMFMVRAFCKLLAIRKRCTVSSRLAPIFAGQWKLKKKGQSN